RACEIALHCCRMARAQFVLTFGVLVPGESVKTARQLAGTIAISIIVCALASDARAGNVPAALRDIGVREHLGARIDTSLAFTDHEGRTVTLAEYFDGSTPVLLTLNYFHCAMLCDVQLSR